MNLEEAAHPKGNTMDKSEVDKFEKLYGQLINVYGEMSLLSKKNQNDAVSKFKLKFVNKLLVKATSFCQVDIAHLMILDALMRMISLKIVMLFSFYLSIFSVLRSYNLTMLYWSMVHGFGELWKMKMTILMKKE